MREGWTLWEGVRYPSIAVGGFQRECSFGLEQTSAYSYHLFCPDFEEKKLSHSYNPLILSILFVSDYEKEKERQFWVRSDIGVSEHRKSQIHKYANTKIQRHNFGWDQTSEYAAEVSNTLKQRRNFGWDQTSEYAREVSNTQIQRRKYTKMQRQNFGWDQTLEYAREASNMQIQRRKYTKMQRQNFGWDQTSEYAEEVPPAGGTSCQ